MIDKTLKELIIIAKKYKLTLSYKLSNGKRRNFNKEQLRKRIIEKIVESDMLELENDLRQMNFK